VYGVTEKSSQMKDKYSGSVVVHWFFAALSAFNFAAPDHMLLV